MCFIARLHVSRVHARSRRARRALPASTLSRRARRATQRTAATARRRASVRRSLARRRRAQHAAAAAPCVRARSPQRKKNPAAAALIGRCPSAAALSLMVKVGKMFVCIETVGRVARRASAAAGSVASRVRAIFRRIICSAGNEIDRDPRRFSEGEHDGHARGPVVVAVVLLCAGRYSWRYRSLGLRTCGGPARPCSWLALISCWMRVRVLPRF